MNTEVLFSERPFLGLNNKGSGNNNNNSENEMFSYISPNEQIIIDSSKLSNDGMINKYIVDIPNKLMNCNVFIQLVSDTLTSSKPFYDNQLIVQVKENYGQLKVLRKSKNGSGMKPLRKTYVKVYALTNGGASEFYKV